MWFLAFILACAAVSGVSRRERIAKALEQANGIAGEQLEIERRRFRPDAY